MIPTDWFIPLFKGEEMIGSPCLWFGNVTDLAKSCWWVMPCSRTNQQEVVYVSIRSQTSDLQYLLSLVRPRWGNQILQISSVYQFKTWIAQIKRHAGFKNDLKYFIADGKYPQVLVQFWFVFIQFRIHNHRKIIFHW